MGKPSISLSSLLLLAILLLALALRLHALDAQSLWNDEGTSVAVAQRDLATITRDAAGDIHPPLYYWQLAAWVRLAGSSEFAVRSLSAVAGVALVALTGALGRLLAGRWAGVAAALLAAINPFQVYYSQEARMYILLALWAAVAMYAALRLLAAQPGEPVRGWAPVYLLAAAAGLYTHYAFPLVLLAINLAVLWAMGVRWGLHEGAGWRWIAGWLALQAGALLLFAPWLPVAYRQLTTWPAVEAPLDLVAAMTGVAQLFSTGPAASPWREAGWILILFLLAYFPRRLGGRLERPVAGAALLAWLVVPVALIVGLGLYKEAYQKFLLVASPAYCLLAGRAAAGLWGERRLVKRAGEWVLPLLILVLVVSASIHGVGDYFTDPAYARDDYRGIAAYIEAAGRPGDAVVLNAPGQQEVFGYYYRGDLPVVPLPEQRPLDPEATAAALDTLARPGGRVWAALWATDESDPQRFVEGWLDGHAYKAIDAWHGNVRLVAYAVPEETPATPGHPLDVTLRDPESGEQVTLLGYSQLDDTLAAGDIAQITLFWQAETALSRRYKVFVHLLDKAHHVAGQRDAEPGGGARLTTLWQPGETVRDNYGLPIHPATPPGTYRVEVGMYDMETGRRLLASGGESQVWLQPVAVERPAAPAPGAVLGMDHAIGASIGPLTLLGNDAHKLGMDLNGRLDLPLAPGDVLQVVLYWRADSAPAGDWGLRLRVANAAGQPLAALGAEPVPGYATSRWQAGDVWRGLFSLALPADIPPGRYDLQLLALGPDGTPQEWLTLQAIAVQ